MIEQDKYKLFICKKHNKKIFSFKKEDSFFNETQCWDCIKEENDKKWKKDNEGEYE